MVKEYIPEQGDIAFIELNPVRGHEQAGYRPCLIISGSDFNKYTHMVIACPISSNVKPFPTHYLLKNTKTIKGSVFCEHIRGLDYKDRKMKFVEKISKEDLESVKDLIQICIDD